MDCELWGTNALIFGYLFCKQKLIFVAFTVYKGFRLNVWLITLETSFVFFPFFYPEYIIAIPETFFFPFLRLITVRTPCILRSFILHSFAFCIQRALSYVQLSRIVLHTHKAFTVHSTFTLHWHLELCTPYLEVRYLDLGFEHLLKRNYWLYFRIVSFFVN